MTHPLPPGRNIEIDRMRDGLYQVTTPYLCAGFTVRGGKVERCAPILLCRLAYWRSIARWVGP